MLLLGMSTSLLAYENTYAVIVGVADYKNFEKGNGDLKYTINDARLFKEFLLSKKGGSVPEENVILLLDEQASRANIIKTASELFAKAATNRTAAINNSQRRAFFGLSFLTVLTGFPT